MHVLVVEDEPIFRLDLTNRLRSLGFDTIHGTAYAEDAVRYAETHTLDLILMDIRLKGEMTGIEAAGEIGSRLAVPILVMSAYHYEPQELETTVPNFFGFLSKPIDDVSLESYCGKVVQH